MLALGRNDLFGVVGNVPGGRVVQGSVTRVDPLTNQVFVTCPGFDASQEFGPVAYDGSTPPVGARCIVEVMTGTTEAWLLSWDGPMAGVPINTWLPLPFAAGYSNYGGPYQVCEFMLDPFGFVHCRGLFKYQTIGSYPSWGPGTLPVGYRPAAEEIFVTMHSSGVNLSERIDVLSNGNIQGSTTDGGNWDGAYGSLDGICFQIASPPTSMPAGPQGPMGPPGQGTPFYGTSPPASPVDGQEWILPADPTNGRMWRFRYNAASASAYKWEFIGGSPVENYADAAVATTSTSLVFLTGGPQLPAAPRPGEYQFQWDGRVYGSVAGQSSQMWLVKQGSTPLTLLDHYTGSAGSGNPSNAQHQSRTWIYGPVNIGEVFDCRYQVNGGTGTFQYRHLQMTPVRVS